MSSFKAFDIAGSGMAAQSVQFLNNGGMLVVLDRTVWDTSWLLSEGSLFGKLLHTLIGYTDQPTEMQLVIYAAVVLVTILLMRLAGSQPPQPAGEQPTARLEGSRTLRKPTLRATCAAPSRPETPPRTRYSPARFPTTARTRR